MTKADCSPAGSQDREAERESSEKQAERARELNRRQRELIRTAIDRMAQRSALMESWYRKSR